MKFRNVYAIALMAGWPSLQGMAQSELIKYPMDCAQHQRKPHHWGRNETVI